MRRRRRPKAVRVLGGTILMAAFVLICFAVLTRYAGGWGVPYFTFTTDRGSTCTNTFTGYVCSPTTLDDVRYFGDVDLPDDTRVVTGTYTSTHDYRLNARLEVPKASSAAALKTLNLAFGRCLTGHVSPIDPAGLTALCVLANDDTIVQSGEPTSRLYSIGTGVRKDGVRVIALSIRSR